MKIEDIGYEVMACLSERTIQSKMVLQVANSFGKIEVCRWSFSVWQIHAKVFGMKCSKTFVPRGYSGWTWHG